MTTWNPSVQRMKAGAWRLASQLLAQEVERRMELPSLSGPEKEQLRHIREAVVPSLRRRSEIIGSR